MLYRVNNKPEQINNSLNMSIISSKTLYLIHVNSTLIIQPVLIKAHKLPHEFTTKLYKQTATAAFVAVYENIDGDGGRKGVGGGRKKISG